MYKCKICLKCLLVRQRQPHNSQTTVLHKRQLSYLICKHMRYLSHSFKYKTVKKNATSTSGFGKLQPRILSVALCWPIHIITYYFSDTFGNKNNFCVSITIKQLNTYAYYIFLFGNMHW